MFPSLFTFIRLDHFIRPYILDRDRQRDILETRHFFMIHWFEKLKLIISETQANTMEILLLKIDNCNNFKLNFGAKTLPVSAYILYNNWLLVKHHTTIRGLFWCLLNVLSVLILPFSGWNFVLQNNVKYFQRESIIEKKI